MVAGTTSTVFINEIHYDNAGGDTGEFIEIANTTGRDLTGWTVVLYNGGTPGAAVVYGATVTLSGSAAFFQISFPTDGLQNGGSDGFALIDASGNVVQLLSYEGVFTAANGPAAGLTSTNIGVAESGTTPVGFSLQLQGSGTTYGDFVWGAAPIAATAGAANTGQTIGGAQPEPGTLSIGNASVIEGDVGTASLVFTVTRTGGADGAVSADYAVAFGTANAADITGPISGTVSFADGQTTATITLGVVGDTVIEFDETLQVTLSNPLGGAAIAAASATGTIINDDLPPQGPAEVFINEIHYDTAGTDVGEFIEIAGPAGTDLTGWTLVLYNGTPK